MSEDWGKYREKIIGLGENSVKKSYYPALQQKLEELEILKSNLQAIIDNANDGIVIHNKKGEILLLNNKAYELFNIPRGRGTDFTIFDISAPHMDKNKLYKFWEDVLNGTPQIIEWIISQYQTDNYISVQVSISSTYWYGEKVVIASARDFSERKKYEEELILAKERAEESDRLKSAFLANMSHEIRTPMNGILGFTQLLINTSPITEIQKKYLEIIEKSGYRLLNLIEDLISLAIIESKNQKVSYSEIDIGQELKNLYDLLLPEAQSKNLKLSFEIPLAFNYIKIISDSGKLTSILTNLIKNAIKFTNKGSVKFGISSIDNNVNFFVKDTGRGIPEDKTEIIFERFRQADIELTRSYEGAGLGLSIVKAYVELLNGQIALKSKPGEGSSFYFSIPFILAEESSEKHEIAENKKIDKLLKSSVLANRKILIVDDDKNAQEYLSTIFMNITSEIYLAENGEIALSLFNEHRDIELILMDIKMPVLDGYETTRKIRKIDQNVVIIVQTAYAFKHEEDLAIAAGCTDYISKPIILDKFIPLVEKYFKNTI